MRLALGVTVLATATGCGAKQDPYAASLAKGSEHVRFTGSVEGVDVWGTGDFTNHPDRGRVTFADGSGTTEQVINGHTLYTLSTYNGRQWTSKHVSGLQTPAQMFRARVPATIVDGLVRWIVLDGITYDFSKYGAHVSVHVPKVKGG